jgi:hypothetical protein
VAFSQKMGVRDFVWEEEKAEVCEKIGWLVERIVFGNERARDP